MTWSKSHRCKVRDTGFQDVCFTQKSYSFYHTLLPLSISVKESSHCDRDRSLTHNSFPSLPASNRTNSFHPSTESSEHTASWHGTDMENGGAWIGTNWCSRRHKAILNDRQTYHLGVRKGVVWWSYSLIATQLLSSKPLRPSTLLCFLSPGRQEGSLSGSQHIYHLGKEKLNHERNFVIMGH